MFLSKQCELTQTNKPTTSAYLIAIDSYDLVKCPTAMMMHGMFYTLTHNISARQTVYAVIITSGIGM